MNFGTPQFDRAGDDRQDFLSPGEVVVSVWRLAVSYRRPIIRSVIVFALLAVGYLIVTPKQYLATAEMIIDPRKSQDGGGQSSAQMADAAVDPSVVESEGTVLASENIVLAVIKKLDLTNSPTFAQPQGVVPLVSSLVSPIVSRFIKLPPRTDYEKLRATVEDFLGRLTVKRVGVTYVFDISFLSPDPEEAATIANAVAAAYVDDLLGAKYSAHVRASKWMQDRLKTLSEQATAADHAVDDFKREHGIVDTGGRLLSEQQVAELQSQLSLARAAKANAKAKLDRIDDILTTGKLDLSVADALSNQVIINLRDSYVDLSKRATDLEARLGPDHEVPQRLRADMQQVRSSIFEELKRIGEGYRSDYRIASSQEEGLTADLAKAVDQSASTNTAQVQAAQLESDAQAYRALYDTFLQRLGEVVQQQSFPLTETRLVTEASAPLKKSRPKTLLVLAGAIFGGAFFGFGIGWLRDKTDQTLRTGRQAEQVAETALITSVPKLEWQRPEKLAREVITNPLSAFAESIRELKVMIELTRVDNKTQVIGFTSAVSGEGKSTIVANLAALIAKSRASVIVLDCDIRNPSLSRFLPPAASGLVETLLGETSLDDAIFTDALGGFDYLPVSSAGSRGDSSDLLSSIEMKDVIERLRGRYDLIIADLPPLLPVIDAKAAAPLFDGFVFVAEWGKTPVESLSEALRTSGRIRDRLIGVVLNKVDVRQIGVHRTYYQSNYLEAAR